ncbi:hypothetical protein DPV78_004344 [Talaromyces pinophilus]|nr:hypothetical protein DPV78_004344 [Talaromyces pinophilus]
MSTPEPSTRLRPASKIEKRFTVRHALDWYRALIIAGLYTVPKDVAFDTHSISSYIPAVKSCIKTHSFLSANIEGLHGESPVFTRPARLDLQNHIQIIDPESDTYKSEGDELELFRKVVLEAHDQPWIDSERIPPWKIVVLPLPDHADSTQKRVYIIYAYSHTHGDAKSALAFHRTFLQGLQTQTADESDQSLIYEPPSSPLPLPLDEACKLKVSWSFLLAPVLAQYMPSIICRLLKIQAAANQLSNDRAYTGEITRYDKDNFRTASQILIVKHDLLAKVLAVCRSQQSKLTGVLNRLIVHALSEILPPETANEFLGQIVVDLRPNIPAYADGMTMGNFVSGAYETASRITPNSDSGKYDVTFWDAVRGTTTRLAAVAGTLDDQPIGLLKYLSNFRSWFLGQLGKKRDSSYEISNIGVFDPTVSNTNTAESTTSHPWAIERTFFSQPANVLGSPLNFQVVTMKGGDMVVTLNWQVGVTGVPDEDGFAKAVLRYIDNGLEKIASGAQ